MQMVAEAHSRCSGRYSRIILILARVTVFVERRVAGGGRGGRLERRGAERPCPAPGNTPTSVFGYEACGAPRPPRRSQAGSYDHDTLAE